MHELGLNHSAGLPAHAKSAQAESTQAESKQASAEEGQEQTSECDCSAKRAFSPPYLRIKSSAKTDLDQAEGPCPLSRTELFELRRAVMQVPDDVVSSEVPNDTLQKILNWVGEERCFRYLSYLPGISLSDRPDEECFIHHEEFCETASPLILEAKTNAKPRTYFTGLGKTRASLELEAYAYHKRTGAHTEVHSIAGHTGKQEDMRDTTFVEWCEQHVQVQERVLDVTGQRATSVPHSTPCLIALLTAFQRPDLFDELVTINPPYRLKSIVQRYGLKLLDRVYRAFPESEYWAHLKVYDRKDAANPLDPNDPIKQLPYALYIPALTVLNMNTLRRLVLTLVEARGFQAVGGRPIVTYQGGQDGLVMPSATHKVFGRRATQDVIELQFITDESGCHNPMHFDQTGFRELTETPLENYRSLRSEYQTRLVTALSARLEQRQQEEQPEAQGAPDPDPTDLANGNLPRISDASGANGQSA